MTFTIWELLFAMSVSMTASAAIVHYYEMAHRYLWCKRRADALRRSSPCGSYMRNVGAPM